jgi:hypothetical protein
MLLKDSPFFILRTTPFLPLHKLEQHYQNILDTAIEQEDTTAQENITAAYETLQDPDGFLHAQLAWLPGLGKAHMLAGCDIILQDNFVELRQALSNLPLLARMNVACYLLSSGEGSYGVLTMLRKACPKISPATVLHDLSPAYNASERPMPKEDDVAAAMMQWARQQHVDILGYLNAHPEEQLDFYKDFPKSDLNPYTEKLAESLVQTHLARQQMQAVSSGQTITKLLKKPDQLARKPDDLAQLKNALQTWENYFTIFQHIPHHRYPRQGIDQQVMMQLASAYPTLKNQHTDGADVLLIISRLLHNPALCLDVIDPLGDDATQPQPATQTVSPITPTPREKEDAEKNEETITAENPDQSSGATLAEITFNAVHKQASAELYKFRYSVMNMHFKAKKNPTQLAARYYAALQAALEDALRPAERQKYIEKACSLCERMHCKSNMALAGVRMARALKKLAKTTPEAQDRVKQTAAYIKANRYSIWYTYVPLQLAIIAFILITGIQMADQMPGIRAHAAYKGYDVYADDTPNMRNTPPTITAATATPFEQLDIRAPLEGQQRAVSIAEMRFCVFGMERLRFIQHQFPASGNRNERTLYNQGLLTQANIKEYKKVVRFYATPCQHFSDSDPYYASVAEEAAFYQDALTAESIRILQRWNKRFKLEEPLS